MNIGDLLTDAANIHPERTALVYGDSCRTYRDFDDRTTRLAIGLQGLGVHRGNRVALLQYNRPEFLEGLFACFKAGVVAVPINFRLHPKEIVYIIDHCSAKAVILSPEFVAATCELRRCLPKVRNWITAGCSVEGLLDYESLLDRGKRRFSNATVAPEEVAWLFYTSGTTGQPKGAMLTHGCLLAMVTAYFKDFGRPGIEDTVLHAAPLSHGSGLYSLPNIAGGGTSVITTERSFNPKDILAAIEKHGVTSMFAAPTMVKMLVEAQAGENFDLSSLRHLIYGGGPIHVADLKQAIDILGPSLTQLYGLGEAPMTISYLPHRDHVVNGSLKQLKRLASAGIARSGVRFRVVDGAGKELPRGDVGEIVTRSDVVMRGYWRDQTATREAIRDGWLYTGDRGFIDTDDYLFLLDRAKDMIISGGENIYSREVEEVLAGHPSVREVAVIGIPHKKWGEAVHAVIALRAEAIVEASELQSYCKQYLAAYKKPSSVEFVETLPKNNFGKIVKRELREKYWAGHGREI